MALKRSRAADSKAGVTRVVKGAVSGTLEYVKSYREGVYFYFYNKKKGGGGG